MTTLRIAGGTIYDPAHHSSAVIGDLWIEDGSVIAPPSDPSVTADRTLDATGLVVMPGGVDMHCHITCPTSIVRLL